MKRSKLPRPTEAELALLRVLWQRGASTVREIWDEVAPAQRTGYTTILKLLQIMFEKGLVWRDEQARSHVYEAAVSEEQAQRQAVGHLLNGVFDGSAPKLVMQALAVKKTSAADLAEIRKLLAEIEGKQNE
jgi:BlaI family transcriptional regulator, penicillinase repressor